LNLQDAAYILNYDLHWNPVRLIQRFGRIDRINTVHKEIYAFNFLPDPKLEEHLGIRQTLRQRINEIHTSIGEDAPILEPDEQLNEEAMYAIYEGDGKALESFEEAEEHYDTLGVQAAEDFIPQARPRTARVSDKDQEIAERLAKRAQVNLACSTGLAAFQTQNQACGLLFRKSGGVPETLSRDRGRQNNRRRPDGGPSLLFGVCRKNPTAQLPADYNALVEKLRAQFSRRLLPITLPPVGCLTA